MVIPDDPRYHRKDRGARDKIRVWGGGAAPSLERLVGMQDIAAVMHADLVSMDVGDGWTVTGPAILGPQ